MKFIGAFYFYGENKKEESIKAVEKFKDILSNFAIPLLKKQQVLIIL